MTKSRSTTTREIYGLLGKFRNKSELLRQWNQYFGDQGIDAVMVHYPCTVETIPERLSEMFHFDRRMYLVSVDLSDVIPSYLDESEYGTCPSGRRARNAKLVNVVVNRRGVLCGEFCREMAYPEKFDIFQRKC